MFDVCEQTAANIFYSLIVLLFQHRNNIAVLTLPSGAINQQEVDKMLENIKQNTPTFYQELVKDIKDPSGMGRQPVILQVRQEQDILYVFAF